MYDVRIWEGSHTCVYPSLPSLGLYISLCSFPCSSCQVCTLVIFPMSYSLCGHPLPLLGKGLLGGPAKEGSVLALKDLLRCVPRIIWHTVCVNVPGKKRGVLQLLRSISAGIFNFPGFDNILIYAYSGGDAGTWKNSSSLFYFRQERKENPFHCWPLEKNKGGKT